RRTSRPSTATTSWPSATASSPRSRASSRATPTPATTPPCGNGSRFPRPRATQKPVLRQRPPLPRGLVVPRPDPAPWEGWWRTSLVDPASEPAPPTALIGALPDYGIGTEVVDASIEVLRQLALAGGQAVELEMGGPIGLAAEPTTGTSLPDDVTDFCRD